jgi:DNA-binding helix-hairpin-helix protein with protein kinase domain
VKRLSERLDAIDDPQRLVEAACSDDASLPSPPGRPLPAGTREFQGVVYGLAILTVCSALVMLLGLLSTTFFYIGLVCTIGAALGTLMALWQAPLPRIRRERRKALAAAKASLASAQQQARSQSSRLCADFAARLKPAAAMRNELQSLHDQEARELKLLQATVRERQLDDFLGGCLVHTAKLNKLTPDRVLILQSYGVESARQINEKTIASIHGIGQTLPPALLAWRKSLEAKFHFDDRRGLPPLDVAKVRHKYVERRLVLQEELEVDLEQLAQLSAQGRKQAAAVQAFVRPLQLAVAQATADLQECGRRSERTARSAPAEDPDIARRAAG